MSWKRNEGPLRQLACLRAASNCQGLCMIYQAGPRFKISRIAEDTPVWKGPVDNPQAAAEFWHAKIVPSEFFNHDQECLVSVPVTSKFRVIGWNLVSLGILNESLAHPREVFRGAILIAAFAVLVMHNHPSGDPSPSEADLRLTRRLQEAARILQIQLLDHIIVGASEADRQGYFSFKEAGILG